MEGVEYVGEDMLDPYIRECKSCSGEMHFKGSGRYVCSKCGYEYLTDFGKIKNYLTEKGPRNAFEISEATGVSNTKIYDFIRQGRIDVAQNPALGQNYCAACGVALEFGTFCPECAKQMKRGKAEKENKGIYNVLLKNPDKKDGEMRFIK
jgi:DNA-directed RNA polymerase subunit M/transcription elongation factor TFIIS